MKKRNHIRTVAVSRETLHKILYGLAIKRAGKQKAKKPVPELAAVES